MSSQPRGEDLFLSGLKTYLLEQPGVCEVTVTYGTPLSPAHIVSWEQTHQLTLPKDFKTFYTSHNGVSLSWQYRFNKKPITLGTIDIKPLAKLSSFNPLTTVDMSTPSLLDICDDSEDQWTPSFTDHCRIISFTSCITSGHICLIFKHRVSEETEFAGIWLLDLSLNFHFLSHTFSEYLCLAQVHLGLKQWPYAVTSIGLSPDYIVWFEIFIPHRLSLDVSRDEEDSLDDPFPQTKPDLLKFSTKGNKLFRDLKAK